MTNDATVSVLRALGDEVRLSMVRAIARERRPVSGCDIVSSCASLGKLSQPAASHHFQKLVEAGVFKERKAGVAKQYQLDRAVLKAAGINLRTL